MEFLMGHRYIVPIYLEQSTAPSVDGVLVARTLVNIKSLSHCEWLISHQQQMINKGTELACCETVISVHTPEANM